MKHCVILVPGLGDRIPRHKWFTKGWEKENIEVYIHAAPWNKKEESFQTKLARLIKRIDELSKKGYKISLVGTSAGGSMVINAFAKRKSKIHKVISVCGRVRKGDTRWLPLVIAAKGHPAFYESVVVCEQNLKLLSAKNKEKIMTVSPFPFDAVVPMSCIPIDEATNTTVPIPFHMLGIGAALSFFKKPLINFILSK